MKSETVHTPKVIVRDLNFFYGNYRALKRFRDQVIHAWRQQLNRRSQRGWADWKRMGRYSRRWLPPARIYHPAPSQRMRVPT